MVSIFSFITRGSAFQYLSLKLPNSQLVRNSKENDLTYFLGCAPLQLSAGFQFCLVVFPPIIKNELQPAKSTIFLVWLMSTWMNDWGYLCILCAFLYLMTRWLWNTAEAGATNLSQRRPIAQCLVHRVNNDIICLYTQPRWNKETHMQFYSWHTHTVACLAFWTEGHRHGD